MGFQRKTKLLITNGCVLGKAGSGVGHHKIGFSQLMQSFQKLAGARNNGAELFLMPAVHCKEAADHVPDGLTVAAVSTVTEAVTAVETWTSGGTPVGCPADEG